MRRCCTRVVRWGWFWLWKQSWGNVAGLPHDTPFPLSHPHCTALSQQSTLTISLTHGKRYESHPSEVKLSKVVSSLLRGADVLFLRLQAMFFSFTPRR